MRLATLARRTTALTASVALLTTGGAATGLLGGLAQAVGTAPVVGSASPNAAFNTATSTITINGTGFVPASDTVRFVPNFTKTPPTGGALISTISKAPDTQNSTSTALAVAVPLTMAAPGEYDVVVDQTDVPPVSSAPCSRCFVVTSVGPATATSVVLGVNGGNTDRGPGKIDINGTNFARGSSAQFLNLDCTVDTAVTFKAQNVNANANVGGYPSSTQLQGNYTTAAGYNPGRHLLRVLNTDGKVSDPNNCFAGTTDFYLPKFVAGGVSPTSYGAGAVKKVVTVTGQGFRQGSTLSIGNLNGGGCQNGSDVQTGAATVNADGTSISAPVTLLDSCTTPPSSNKVGTGSRNVTVSGPDGASLSVPSAFVANAAPIVTTLDKAVLGRGGSRDFTIQGSGFVGGTTPTVFSFGGAGVSTTTKSVLSGGGSALVTVTAAPDAVLGGRSVTATNPDSGSSVLGSSGLPNNTYPLTINPAPVATSLAPASSARATTKNIVVTGTGFDANGMSVTFSGTGVGCSPGTSSCPPSTVTVTKGVNGASDTATFQVNVDANAPAGLRDVVLTNAGSSTTPGDLGAFTCKACFGIDSLSVAPSADGNTNSASNVTLTGTNMTSGGTVSLLRPGADPSTAITASTTFVSTSQSTATLNLLNEAPGKYNVTYTGTSDNVPLSCASCFTITGQTPTFTSITPAAGGQGAVNLPFTIKGTLFAKGSQVTIAGATVHNVVFVDPQTLTGQVDIPAAAATGAAAVKVLTADGSKTSNSGTFTINAAPVVKTISPAALGQGAKGVTVTVKGTGFVPAATGEPGSQLDLGPSITVSKVAVTKGQLGGDDTLTAAVDVAQGALVDTRDVVVTNSDAGRGLLAKGFKVNAGPVVTSITPAVLARGAANQAVTISGSGFAPDAVPTVNGLTFSGTPTVSSNGTTITGNGSVPADATRGARDVLVTNPSDKGQGSCTACFTIADLPGAPVIRSTTPGVNAVTVSWSPPADNGGSPITQYTLSADDGTSATSVAGDQTSATLNGLTAGRTYTLTLTAQNVQGAGPGATTTATPTKATPSTGARLTSVRAPLTALARAAVTYSGRLTRDDGTPISGATVTVMLTPDIGGRRLVGVTTGTDGTWSFRYAPTYNTTVAASFAGDQQSGAVDAIPYKQSVKTRVVRQSPATGQTTPAGSTLAVKGYTTPNKAGRTIGLYEGTRLIARSTVASNGYFTINVRLPRGIHTIHIGLGVTSGNVAGDSGNFVVKRS